MPKKIARWALLGVGLLSLLFAYHIKDLRFNYVFEDFFPVDDPDLEYYQEFKKYFNNDNDYLLIALSNDPTIYDSTFLHNVAQLTEDISVMENVLEVQSITTISQPVISPAGIFEIPLVHAEEPHRYTADSSRTFANELYIASVVSDDARSTALFVRHDKLISKDQADNLVSIINSRIDQYSFDEVHVAGKVYAQGVFIEKMKTELLIFLSASILLVIVFLAFAYRSWWGVLIPLLVVMLSTIWVLGLMGWTGKSLDILMVLLPTIMFVVGMSDVVHIMTKYIEKLREGSEKIDAIKTTFKEVGIATFLTSLTTSVGFLTLLTASVKPIKEFGLYTAAGVFLAFIVAFTVLPSCLIFLKRPSISRQVVNRSAWFRALSWSFINSLRKGKAVISMSIIISAISVVGISLIVINTYLIEDLPEDDPLKQDFIFFDQEFGGSRPFEVTVIAADSGSIFQPAVLNEIDKIERYLKDEYQAGNVVSPVTLVKGLHQAVNGGSTAYFKLPDTEKSWRKVKRYLPRVLRNNQSTQLVTDNRQLGRISARVGDIGSSISLQRTEQLKEFIAQETNTDLVIFKVTGTSNLIDKNNAYLSRNMFQGLGIAFGVVAIIAGLLFRSLRMVFITLVPNIIPLLMVAAIMGFAGVTLKLSTSIIFTIAFGIAVDDTIHFISKLKIELNKNKSLLYALKRSYLSTGKAIIVTSLILSGGFLILILSDFGGTFYTGLLISLTLIFAVLIDLTLLPVLIMYFYKSKLKPTKKT